MSRRHITLNLSYLSHGTDNSTAMLMYHALRNEQERLITQLVKEHGEQDYEKAAITNDELERVTNEMGRITTALANECERLSLELLKLQNPKEYEQRKITLRDKSNELSGLYDERFFGKPYKPDSDEAASE